MNFILIAFLILAQTPLPVHKVRWFTDIEDMGGLHVVGTERHEARRIDNQLRGRAGRQGDKGSSRFFVGLEDDLMRLFSGETTMKVLASLGMKEGDFKDTYLRTDDDGDNVLKEMPCAFLGADNYCTIYDMRPSDCARFPYMDDDFMLKRQPLALKNISFCPITYYVIEKLIEAEKGK